MIVPDTYYSLSVDNGIIIDFWTDGANDHRFGINPSCTDNIEYKRVNYYIPRLSGIKANGFRLYAELCDEQKMPITVQRNCVDETDPNCESYTIMIPDLLSGEVSNILITHGIFGVESKLRVITKRLSTTIEKSDITIASLNERIRKLENRIGMIALME